MTSCPPVPKFNKKHDAYSSLKPEALPINTPLTFTISPADKEQYYEEKDRVNRFREQLYGRLLIHLSPYASYDLYVEISQAGRLHCHGLLTVKDILGFFSYAIPFMREHMTFEIDTIKEMDIWLTYCQKQAHIFKDGVNPRVKSTKDPLFLINVGKKGSTLTSKRIITFDDYN